MLVILFLVASVLNVARLNNAASAPFITKCRAADKECIKKNVVTTIPLFGAGIPELGVETLDPTYIEFVDASNPSLKFFLRNITIVGLSNTIPLQIRRDVSKSKLFLKLECAVESRGLYEMSGNVLAINILGEGPLYVKIHFIIDLDVDLEEVTGKDSKKHLSIRKFEYTYNLIGKSEVSFENLFPDNEVLRQATTEVIKNNGNNVVKEIGGPMFHASVTKNVNNINNFFKAIPIEDFSFDI